jgi:hypothetical protein
MKVISKILNETSYSNLQLENLNNLLEWSNKLSIKFNENEWKVMHIENTNPQFDYKINGHILQKNFN